MTTKDAIKPNKRTLWITCSQHLPKLKDRKIIEEFLSQRGEEISRKWQK
jgi:hypothetical protein